MTLIKLTLLTDDSSNGMSVWFHHDEIRRVIPLQYGSGVFLLNGENQKFQETAERIAELVNGGTNLLGESVSLNKVKKINKSNEQKTQETV
jgi:hypothetical protein